ALCSAKNPITAWVLHCRLREEMLVFLGEWEEGRYLPRERIALDRDDVPLADSAESKKEEDAAGEEKNRRRKNRRAESEEKGRAAPAGNVAGRGMNRARQATFR
ncbi:MAG: hypothetical protein ACLFTV_01200, partial [Desulfococcaceae bacterium]